MYRVYIGNLDHNVTEEDLKLLLNQLNLSFRSIVLKRSYAFVDCLDKINYEKTIRNLNGYFYLGTNLSVEPAAISKRIRSNDLIVSNFPGKVEELEVEKFLSTFGKINYMKKSMDGNSSIFHVIYETSEDANNALLQLNESKYKERTLKVDYHDSKPTFQFPPRTIHLDYPLRMLIGKEHIGLIIGKKGQTIKNLSNQCQVKIDVNGKENSGMLEKIITIIGSQGNCSEACKQILNILFKNSQLSESREISLKLLVDDQYCGRIIGKEGRGIKKIREKSGSKISISNVQEMAVLYPDRVISIKGTLENMIIAENMIAERLRECLQKEGIPETATPSNVSTSSPPQRMPSETFSSSSSSSTSKTSLPETQQQQQTHQPILRSQSPLPQQKFKQQLQICHIGIPNFAVGAIIGFGGINIKKIIRDSNAQVTVENKKISHHPSEERIATIRGSADSCWRACFFIYEKIKQEGFAGTDGEVRLRTVISIPRALAGRVVGKGGKSVREIQRSSGAMIKLSADIKREQQQQQQQQQQTTHPQQPSTSVHDYQQQLIENQFQLLHPYSSEQEELILEQQKQQYPNYSTNELVVVEIFGNFVSIQSAQSRIRSIISKSSFPSSPPSQPPS